MNAMPESSFTMPGRQWIGELLAYAGGALALVGAATSFGRSTTRVGQIVLLGVIAFALLCIGEILGDAADARRRRIRAVFWLLGHSAAVQTVNLLLSQQFDVQSRVVLIATGVVGVVIGAFLWMRLRSSLQQIALFSSALLLVEGIAFPNLNSLGFSPPSFDLMVFAQIALGIVWLILSLRGIITPRRTGLVLGSVSIVVAPIFLSASADPTSGFLLMALLSAGVIGLGEGIGDLAVAGIGIGGLIFGSAIGWTAAIKASTSGSVAGLVVGLAAVAIGAVLLRGTTTPPVPTDATEGPASPPPPMPPPVEPPLSGGEPQG